MRGKVRLKPAGPGRYDVTRARKPTGFQIVNGDPDEPGRWLAMEGTIRHWSYRTRKQAQTWIEDEIDRRERPEPLSPPVPIPPKQRPPLQLSVPGTQITLGDWLSKRIPNPPADNSGRDRLQAIKRALRVLRQDDPRSWMFATSTHGPVLAALLLDREAAQTI